MQRQKAGKEIVKILLKKRVGNMIKEQIVLSVWLITNRQHQWVLTDLATQYYTPSLGRKISDQATKAWPRCYCE
ncbi:hypothetical protein [Holospora elegans]|uniref:hypothetical protein n=1 Tax=Holospora elegans TaxID=431043 RepID=UPI0005580D3A|nr:hypothetical protein [Holospora elegans]